MKLALAFLLLTFPVFALTQPSGPVNDLVVNNTLTAPSISVSTTSGISTTGVISATALYTAGGLLSGASTFKTFYGDNQIQGSGATFFWNTSANNNMQIGGNLSKLSVNAPGSTPAENFLVSGTSAFLGVVTVSNSILIAQGGFGMPLAAAGVTPTTVRKGALALPNTGGPCYYNGSSWRYVSDDTACTF